METQEYSFSLKDLHNEKTDFLDKDLGLRRNDVLYRVRHHGRDLYVYILVEHQSEVDHLMSYRMTQYVLRILEKYVKEHAKASRKEGFQLPMILPIIFFNGEGAWTATTNIRDKFMRIEELEQYQLSMSSMIIKLNKKPEQEIRELNNVLGLYLFLNHAELQKKYEDKIFEILIQLVESMSTEDQELFLMYVQSIAQSLLMELPPQTVEELKSLKETKGAKEAMKTLERMYQENYYRGKTEGLLEGKKEGILEGILKGKLESAILMLENGDNLERVAGLLSLDVEDIRKEMKRRERN